MAIRTYKVTLDSKNSIAPDPVFLRQGDKTGAVVIDATLMDNGAPVSLDGLTPMFKANTADGQAVIADSTGFNIVNASGGEFTYQVPNALSAIPGKIMTAYFSFSDSSGSESTFDVAFIIKKAVDITKPQADEYITIIDGTLNSLQKKIDDMNIDIKTVLNAYNQGDFYNKSQTDSKYAQVTEKLAQTENEIPVTAYMTKEELEDIKLSTPLLNHSNSIQNYVDDMRAKNLFGLYFPSGNYRFKNIDLGEGNWSVTGPFVASGYIQKVTFNIISELNAKAFIGSNRYMSVANIHTVNSGTKDDGLNVGFYKNTIKNGAFFNATNMMLSNFSGDCFDILDAIDTKFEGIRATDNNNVFKIKKAEWVASTTVTLKKVYAERNNSVIDAPFCRQSKMDDVIFEYNKKIGDITDGSWTLDNLYLENNEAPLDATNSLLTKLYTYSMTANDNILNTQPNVASVDKGDSQLNWKGLNASKVSYDTLIPRTIFTGNYIGDSWVKLGRWESFEKGGRLQITLLGGSNWGQNATGANGPVGETVINLLHGINTEPELANTVGFCYHIGGYKPLLEVKVKAVEPKWRDKFDIYVKVSSNARFVSADYKVVKGLFMPDLVTGVNYPGDNDKNVQGVEMEYNIQTKTGSFGIKDNGQLDMKAPITGGGTMPKNVKNYLPIIVNGVSYNIPLL